MLHINKKHDALTDLLFKVFDSVLTSKITSLFKQCFVPGRSRAKHNSRHLVNHAAADSREERDEMKLLIPAVKLGHRRGKTDGEQTHVQTLNKHGRLQRVNSL